MRASSLGWQGKGKWAQRWRGGWHQAIWRGGGAEPWHQNTNGGWAELWYQVTEGRKKGGEGGSSMGMGPQHQVGVCKGKGRERVHVCKGGGGSEKGGVSGGGQWETGGTDLLDNCLAMALLTSQAMLFMRASLMREMSQAFPLSALRSSCHCCQMRAV